MSGRSHSEPGPDAQPDAKPPPSMAKLVTLATLAVLLVGGLAAGGIAWSLHRFGGGSSCPPASPRAAATTPVATTFPTSGPEQSGGGWVIVGDSADMRERAKLSPYYLTLGGRCEYWVALEHGVLYAYKARLVGSSCAVIWNEPDHAFICHQTKEIVPRARLERWPARVITSGPNRSSFEIDFG